MMLNFFIKTKLKYQMEEYLRWKGTFSFYVAQEHKDILFKFSKGFKHKNISEIRIEDIKSFYENSEMTSYTKIKAMQAIRGFLSYFWASKIHNIPPRTITNEGVKDLQIVAEIDRIEPMIRKKVGRPPNVAFIKKVRKLKDEAGLSFRAIARAEKSYPGNVCRAYHYDLSKLSLPKELSTGEGLQDALSK